MVLDNLACYYFFINW